LAKSHLFRSFGIALLVSTGLAVQPTLADWPEQSVAIGAEEHPKIVAQFGGIIENEALSNYVAKVGGKMIAQTDRADELWTVSVLDTPVVNAFAVQGGYVYVTRGLLAIANNEAELAGVLGHEIAHIVLGHGEERKKQENKVGIGVVIGTVLGGILGGGEGAADAIELSAKLAKGYMASHSKAQEFEADNLGVRLLAKAGYRPLAEADFLDQLSAKEALELKVSGQQYNPNRVDFFATHPATGKRIRKAIAEAAKAGFDAEYGDLNEAAYLRQIDGMIYGDTPREGYVRGLTFSHPEMKFTFTVPRGFVLENSSFQVSATNNSGARFILDGEGVWDGEMTGYIKERWIPGIREFAEVSNVRRVRKTSIHGLDAATAKAVVSTDDGPRFAHLTAIRHGDMTIRITTLSHQQDVQSRDAMIVAAQTFRALADEEIARLSPYFVRIKTVVPGDTFDQLSATMPLTNFRKAQFRAINGYGPGEALQAGDLIKVIE